MTTTKPSDFVMVQLTESAQKLNAVRISTAHIAYEFKGTGPVRVLTSEWTRLLQYECRDGKKLFQIAAPVIPSPVPAAPQGMSTKAAASLNVSQPTPEAVPEVDPQIATEKGK